MIIRKIAATCFGCLLLGCATLSETARMEEHERVMDAYATAMRLSDFNAACQFVDPDTMAREDCMARYDNLKLSSFTILVAHGADGAREVTQEVELEYFFLDRHIVKKIRHQQVWRFREDRDAWLLQTPPPHFR